MKHSNHFFALFVLFLLSTSCLFAQSERGKIHGTVTDAVTGDALIGANVTLKGTSLGIATDIDGTYTLNGVPAGTYTLVVRYIGYKGKDVQIDVKPGANLLTNVQLGAETITGEEVIVTAQAKGQMSAINQQLASNTISNVVSSERIHELPDASAAAALSRLPGVSLMNGDQVVIRGVEAKMNQVLVNGIEMPSTNMDDRSTNLGFVSSNLLDGIEVIKAITPDMDANTIGGVVNLKLREAPSGLHFDVLAQGNYNATIHLADNYKFWASVSQRFFDDKFGVFIQGNMDRTHGGNQSASIGVGHEFLPGVDVWGQGVYSTNSARFTFDDDIVKNSGGSLMLDYKLPNGKIVLQNTYAGNLTDQNHNVTSINSFTSPAVVYGADRNLYGKDLWINALQAENTFGSIKVDASLSHSFTQQYTRFDHDLGPTNANTVFQSASAPFPILSLTRMDGFSLSDACNVFDNIDPANAQSAVGGGGQWVSTNYNSFKQHLYNASLNVSIPVTFSDEITAIFKTGGKYVRTTRENNIDEYRAKDANDIYGNPAAANYFPGTTLSTNNPLPFRLVMDNNFTMGKYFLNSFYDFKNGYRWSIDRDKYDGWLKASSQGWANAFEAADSWQNDWNGAEQFSAGYLMGTFNVGTKLTVLGGARFESYNMNYHAEFTWVQHNVMGNAISTENGSIRDSVNPVNLRFNVNPNTHNVDRTDNNVFPGVQVQYKFNEYSDLRVAYTTGISRPNYTQIIPKIEFEAGSITAGNPSLKPAMAQNIDILGTIHNNTLGLFSVGLFYKEIKNQVYGSQIIYKDVNRYSDVWLPDSAFFYDRFGYILDPTQTVNLNFNNKNLGYIRGVEIDWQTNFWYLPRPFNALVLDVNYTKSGSNTNYMILRKIVTDNWIFVHGHLQNFPITSTSDTSFSGRLVQQANDVVNAALGIDYKGFSGRLSFSMTGDVMNSIGSRPEEMQYTGNIYRWDFSLKQNLPIDGLSLALNGTNIFHNGISFYRDYRLAPNAPITKNLVQVLYSPTTFEMNLRYSF